MTDNIHGDSKSDKPTHNNHGCEPCRDHVVYFLLCHFCRGIVPLTVPPWLLASDCFAMTGDDDAEFVQYIEEYFFCHARRSIPSSMSTTSTVNSSTHRPETLAPP